MQIVQTIDIADALRVDLAEFLPWARIYATPSPDVILADDVCIECHGGMPESVVSSYYDLTFHVWAATPKRALARANEVYGKVAAIDWLSPTSGRHYRCTESANPYENPKPSYPKLARATFTATVATRGDYALS